MGDEVGGDGVGGDGVGGDDMEGRLDKTESVEMHS
jgi:hypothetical protein